MVSGGTFPIVLVCIAIKSSCNALTERTTPFSIGDPQPIATHTHTRIHTRTHTAHPNRKTRGHPGGLYPQPRFPLPYLWAGGLPGRRGTARTERGLCGVPGPGGCTLSGGRCRCGAGVRCTRSGVPGQRVKPQLYLATVDAGDLSRAECRWVRSPQAAHQHILVTKHRPKSNERVDDVARCAAARSRARKSFLLPLRIGYVWVPQSDPPPPPP